MTYEYLILPQNVPSLIKWDFTERKQTNSKHYWVNVTVFGWCDQSIKQRNIQWNALKFQNSPENEQTSH